MTSQPAAGIKFGRFDAYEKIGEGGFGTVYKGYDPTWEKPVAIKVLKADFSSNPDFLRRFQTEAKTGAMLRHPHIVGVLEMGEESGRYYIVMEYVTGGSLAEKMGGGKALSLSEAVSYLAPIAEALDYMHSKKVIHRDVKPVNILLNEDGQPMLTDFSIVRVTEETGPTTTMVMGTVEYMAPEQITGRELTPAADLYSLGVVAYQMLTGRPPFTGATPYEIQKGHVELPAPAPRSMRPELPEELNAVLVKMLAKDPGQRYASGKEFVAALRQVAEQGTRQMAESLTLAAEKKASLLDFDGAVSALKEALLIAPTPEREAQLQEYTRRGARRAEYLALLRQQTEVRDALETLSRSEPWLVSAPQEAQPVQPGAKKPNVWQVILQIFIILLEVSALYIGFQIMVNSGGVFIYELFGFILFGGAVAEMIWHYWLRKRKK